MTSAPFLPLVRRALLLGAVALAGLAACKPSEKSAATKPADPKPVASSSAAPSPSASAPADAAAAVGEAEVDALLARWAATQSAGDVPGFLALHDEAKFRATTAKADGKSVERGFAAWRAEQTALLASKPEVTATRRSIGATPDGAVVKVLTRFRLGDYGDHGVTTLTVRRDGAALRIVAEEAELPSPGFDDPQEVEPLDLSTARGPLGVELTYGAAKPKAGAKKGKPERALAVVIDARGKKTTLELLRDTPAQDFPEMGFEPAEANTTGLLFEQRVWQGRVGHGYRVAREGDQLVVKQSLILGHETPGGIVTDRETGFASGPRVKLPAGAVVGAK